MKKHLLMKTLLVALVCLVGGTSSLWGAPTSYLTTLTGQVGTATNSGDRQYATKKVKIAAGETYVYTLTNFNDGNNEHYWQNWVVEGNLGGKYFDCEARGNQWQTGSGPEPSYTPVMAYTDVENFQTAYNGANVTITISRNAAGNQFTVTHTSNVLGTTAGNTDKYYGGTWTVAVGAEEEWDIYITEEYAHFVVTKVVYTYDGGGNVYVAPEHTAGSQWGNNTGASTVDANKEHYNNDSSTGWAGCAYAKFSYPELPDGITITAATMYYSVNQGGKSARNDIIYYMKKDFDLDWANFAGQTATDLRNTANRAGQAVASAPTGGTGDRLNLNQSVLTSVSAIYDAGQKYILFQWTGNAGAADLYGKTSEHAPFLEIAYTSATVYTATFTETNSLSPVVTIYSDAGMTSPVTNGTLENGTTYYYKAVLYGYNDVTGNFTVSGADPSINITMTAKATYNYSLKYKLGTADAVELEAGTKYVDETKTIYYPICRQDASENYYVVSKNNSAPYFGVVISSSNKDVTINYTLDEDIVYYAESENMAGTRSYGEAASYSSNGVSYCSGAANNSYIATNWSVAAGYYDIEVGMANRNYAVNPAPKLMTNSTDESPTVLGGISLSASSYTQKTYLSQQIAAGQNLYIFNDNGSNASKWALDYVILRKLPTSVSVTVTDAGYATYVPSYDLNFSATEIEAYKVKVSSKGVATLTKVNNVPAGTPVLLYKDGGKTENIPVMTGAAAVTENDLVAGTGAAVATTVGDYTNMILNNIGGNVGFYFAAGQTVATNRAYLHFAKTLAPDPAAARMTMIFEDEDVTSISEELRVKSEEFAPAADFYDLQGRKVAQPTKGLYIVNGKKVVLK